MNNISKSVRRKRDMIFQDVSILKIQYCMISRRLNAI